MSGAKSVFDRLNALRGQSVELGLWQITRLLDRLDHPERDFPALHVAGTNGKGSVCAMAAAALRRAGHRVGLLTSPHLVHYSERIRVNGAPIREDEAEPILEKLGMESEGFEGSFFEVYLNREAVWSSGFFGISLQGGKEEGVRDVICVRTDSGPRVLSDDRLQPDRWYRLRLTVPAGEQTGTVSIIELSEGEETTRTVVFGGAETVDLTEGQTWDPALVDLDTLVLRLGGAVQVGAVRLTNR